MLSVKLYDCQNLWFAMLSVITLWLSKFMVRMLSVLFYGYQNLCLVM